jgi:hypothetical protein
MRRSGFGPASRTSRGSPPTTPHRRDSRPIGAIARWPETGVFHVQHYLHLMAAVNTDLYVGDAEAAWRRVETAWPRVRASGLLRVSSRAGGSAGLAGARGGGGGDRHRPTSARSQKLMRIADREARKLAREPSHAARGSARLLRAVVARSGGQDATAVAEAANAVGSLAEAGLRLEEAAMRAFQARLLGGETPEAAMRELGVAEPRRLASVVVPGFSVP